MITGTWGDHHFGYWRGKECPVALSVGYFLSLANFSFSFLGFWRVVSPWVVGDDKADNCRPTMWASSEVPSQTSTPS